ncbi:hypothetical protein GCM10009716_26580 [Streptomyces sodiiphilus]|uniref:Uncharacterized protein n=1 Tax=Streptomyces sodiiphilus TaxID=226217 RepID=A0ABN2PC17_9ACTN
MLNSLYSNAVRQLGKAVDMSERHGKVAFSPSFVRSQADGAQPPLARLIQGGRGGEVRLKLYLCITMMATAEPHDIRRPPVPYAWARMLALPPETGPRRVTNNLKWLSRNGFIELEARRGSTPAIKLVSLEAPDLPYVRASTQGRYIGIPLEFWRNGWILRLSPTGIALLFTLLESQGGYEEARYVTSERRDTYGLSHNTWTKGRKELEQYGFLTVKRTPQGTDFDYRRLRNSYWIDEGKFSEKPN